MDVSDKIALAGLGLLGALCVFDFQGISFFPENLNLAPSGLGDSKDLTNQPPSGTSPKQQKGYEVPPEKIKDEAINIYNDSTSSLGMVGAVNPVSWVGQLFGKYERLKEYNIICILDAGHGKNDSGAVMSNRYLLQQYEDAKKTAETIWNGSTELNAGGRRSFKDYFTFYTKESDYTTAYANAVKEYLAGSLSVSIKNVIKEKWGVKVPDIGVYSTNRNPNVNVRQDDVRTFVADYLGKQLLVNKDGIKIVFGISIHVNSYSPKTYGQIYTIHTGPDMSFKPQSVSVANKIQSSLTELYEKPADYKLTAFTAVKNELIKGVLPNGFKFLLGNTINNTAEKGFWLTDRPIYYVKEYPALEEATKRLYFAPVLIEIGNMQEPYTLAVMSCKLFREFVAKSIVIGMYRYVINAMGLK